MKTYYIRKSAATYGCALIIANTFEEAKHIARNVDINDMMEETECYSIDHLVEISSEEAKDYDIPTLQQTQEGYKVKA